MKRLPMRKTREAMRLHAGELSTRKIAASLGVSQPATYDLARPHALEPSALCRLDAREALGAGPPGSAPTRRRWSRSSCASARIPSRAFAPASASCAWPGPTAARGSRRLQAGAGDRCTLLHLGELDPQEQPRSHSARPCRGRPAISHPYHPSHGTRASGTTRRILPLKERRCSTTRRSIS